MAENRSDWVVRTPTVADAAGMARVHVESWKETYRGQMPDELLDDPTALTRREEGWRKALERHAASATASDQSGENADAARSPQHPRRYAVAQVNGEIVGIAFAGPPPGGDADVDAHLRVLYVLRSAHRTGAGQALLDAVIDPAARTSLWVANPNPRAQAFYRRNGFIPDGQRNDEYGIEEIRMVRNAS